MTTTTDRSDHFIDAVLAKHGPMSIKEIIRVAGLGFVTNSACASGAWDIVEKQLTIHPEKYLQDARQQWRLREGETTMLKLTAAQALHHQHARDIVEIVRSHYRDWRGNIVEPDNGYDGVRECLIAELELLNLETLGTLLRAYQSE